MDKEEVLPLSAALYRIHKFHPIFEPFWFNEATLDEQRIRSTWLARLNHKDVGQEFYPRFMDLCRSREWKIDARFDGEVWTVEVDPGIEIGEISVCSAVVSHYYLGFALLECLHSLVNDLTPAVDLH
ncbi:MAG: hypothetical protein AAFX78_04840 [Cyanobacteria bacterium J06638_20]